MSAAGRLDVRKTYKLYVGGKFPRSESGRSYEVLDAKGRFVANAARASRKDARPISVGQVTGRRHAPDHAPEGPAIRATSTRTRRLCGALSPGRPAPGRDCPSHFKQRERLRQ